MNKVEIFSVEINYIKNADLKESLKLIVDKLPDYFFMKQPQVLVNIIQNMLLAMVDF